MVVFDRNEHDSEIDCSCHTNCWINELTDNQILQANLPVVPAGVISLRYLTTSIRFESLAATAKQRIILVVSGVGCSKSVWAKCRFSLS